MVRTLHHASALVGYGEYYFVANMLNELNYTVVSIQHDLPTDPPLPSDGDLYALRMPIWKRGADNILFVRDVLARRHDNLDWTMQAATRPSATS